MSLRSANTGKAHTTLRWSLGDLGVLSLGLISLLFALLGASVITLGLQNAALLGDSSNLFASFLAGASFLGVLAALHRQRVEFDESQRAAVEQKALLEGQVAELRRAFHYQAQPVVLIVCRNVRFMRDTEEFVFNFNLHQPGESVALAIRTYLFWFSADTARFLQEIVTEHLAAGATTRPVDLGHRSSREELASVAKTPSYFVAATTYVNALGGGFRVWQPVRLSLSEEYAQPVLQGSSLLNEIPVESAIDSRGFVIEHVDSLALREWAQGSHNDWVQRATAVLTAIDHSQRVIG